MRATTAVAVLLGASLAAWLWLARPVQVAPAAAAQARHDATAAVPVPTAVDAKVAAGSLAAAGSPASSGPATSEPSAQDRAPHPSDAVPDRYRRTRTVGTDTSARPEAEAVDAAEPGHDDGRALRVPVEGVARDALWDTFEDARSEGRQHDAIDIMAPAGTPVVAVADGHIEKLFDSERGGLTVYQFEPSGRFAYYYAHLQAYAPGLAEGQRVRRGDPIGYVGSTGNADPAAPHLHFAIFRLGPERNWWEGEAINPFPPLRDGRMPD